MQLNFRQGLVAFQVDAGNPQYLKASTTAGYVSLNVNPTATVVTLAHGGSDYLLKFEASVDLAWGPLPSVAAYLYWDVDQLTARTTYGFTTLAPIPNLNAPVNPANDQHWFDLTSTQMKVWSAAQQKWIVKIRLFAGSALGSNITMFSNGSNVGLNTPCNAGFIELDTLLQPLRKNSENGEFLTDGDVLRVQTTVGTSGVLVQPSYKIVPVRAAENIPKMSLVYFYADDMIKLADSNPALIPGMQPVGMCVDALAAGDIGTFVLNGEITYDQWNWEGFAGSPLYCDTDGQVTLARPGGLLAYRIGYVKNAQSILLNIDTETQPHVYTQTVNQIIIAANLPMTVTDVINGIGERVVTLTTPNATAVTAGLLTASGFNQLALNTTAITANTAAIAALQISKADTVHTHLISDVTGLQAALDAITSTSMLIVSPAVAGNLPVLTIDGQLMDSGFAPSAFAPVVHTHLISDVQGLQTALDQKAFRAHLNAIAEIFTTVDRTGPFDVGSGDTLQDVLDQKAFAMHTHSISDVSGLQAALDSKLGLNDSIPISQVIGLQAALDSKADEQAGVVLDVNTKPGPHVVLTTDDIGEGSLNKYLSNANFQILFNAAISAASINELVDVQTEYVDEHNNHIVPLDGQVLTWSDPIQQWIGATTSVNVTSVNTLVGDVILTTTQIPEEAGANPPNQYFTLPRFTTALSNAPLKSLSDVDKNLSPLPFDVLSWDGTVWTNLILPSAPVRMVCGYTSDDFVGGNIALTTADIPENPANLYWTPKRFDDDFKAHYVGDLFDVKVAGAQDGQYLAFSQPHDGGGNPVGPPQWVAAAAPGAPVISVNGKIGAVVLSASDFGITNFYDTAQFTIDLNNQFPTKLGTSTLEQLGNVQGGSDGQFLAYDAAHQKWVGTTVPNALVTSVAGKLGDVTLAPTDIVESTTPGPDTLRFYTDNRFLSNFQQTSIDKLSDVTLTSPQFNDALVYNGSAWINEPIPSAPVLTVNGLTGNVSLSTDTVPEGSTNLYYTGTRFQLAYQASLQTTLLKNLHDVGGYGLGNAGQFLKGVDGGDGTLHWVPADPPGAPVSSVAGRTGAITLTTDDVSEGTNQYFTQARVTAAIGNISIDGFNDVTITSPVAGQVLKWNGAQWVNDVVAVSGSAVIAGLGYTPANRAGDAFTGAISSTSTVTGTRLISNVATGTAPLTVTSTTVVPNLNVSQLNSQSSTYYSDTYMTFALSDETTTPTVGTGKITFRAPFPITLTQIPRMSLSTAGSNLSSVDIKLAGTTVLGANKLSVDASEKTSVTAATPTTLAITAIPDDGEITVDITSVGVGALGFKVTIYFRKT